ncbi:hypothetical protein HYW75_04875 [Candidatus Pacearchaeota archaeon]|nr:hypothetical protein [Candidatus Pacearchaeota archaeon]
MQKKNKGDESSIKDEIDHQGKLIKLEEKILENLVELQKVHTNLAEKFDKLSSNISNLLALFEMAARSFAQSPGNISTEKDSEFLEKIDRLLDQNKTIAKGLTMVEERIRERMYGQRPVERTVYIEQPIQRTETQMTQKKPNDQQGQTQTVKPLPRF